MWIRSRSDLRVTRFPLRLKGVLLNSAEHDGVYLSTGVREQSRISHRTVRYVDSVTFRSEGYPLSVALEGCALELGRARWCLPKHRRPRAISNISSHGAICGFGHVQI